MKHYVVQIQVITLLHIFAVMVACLKRTTREITGVVVILLTTRVNISAVEDCSNSPNTDLTHNAVAMKVMMQQQKYVVTNEFTTKKMLTMIVVVARQQ
jgi:hypothetical protein